MTTHPQTDIDGLSDIGLVRMVNEDAILIDTTAHVFAVADGMGGHGSGDVASKLALSELQKQLQQHDVVAQLIDSEPSDSECIELIKQCIIAVNSAIYSHNAELGYTQGNGMGTTLVGLCAIGNTDRAVLFNVGDSRLYRFADDSLTQLTTDHTMYQDWINAGRVGPAPPKNIIMRAMGLFDRVDIDMDVITLSPDNIYLLCSDGLTAMISDNAIVEIIAEQDSNARLTCEKLNKEAKTAGGMDNISVITLKHYNGRKS
jgi:protein phosphatase